MAKITIITDSLACLTRDQVDQYGITIVPISIYFRDKVYRDWVDISPNDAYKLFQEDPESFTTSPASPAQYVEAYRQASKRADNILCITVSSKLSTENSVAHVAREQVKTLLPHVSIEVVDSQMVTAAQGMVVLAAARSAARGESLPAVIRAAEAVRQRVDFLLLVETVRYVYRTGRIPKVAAQVGAMLNIKPILSMSAGAVHFNSAVRTREHGLERILQMLEDSVGGHAVRVAVMHAYALEEAQKLQETIAARFNCAELWLTEFSPVMGYACGTGSLGFAYYRDDADS